MLLYLLLLFTLVPIAEIFVLIRISEVIEVGPTIGLIILTGVVGAALARREGLRTLLKIQESMSRGIMPAAELVEGMMIFAAGAMLVTPGVLTDALGFSLLIPPIRAFMRKRLTDYFRNRIVVTGPSTMYKGERQDQFIDVEYEDLSEDKKAE